jgi:hypothetical protein
MTTESENFDRAVRKILTVSHDELKRREAIWKSEREKAIGIGGRVASPPLPHHRTSGSASGGSRS